VYIHQNIEISYYFITVLSDVNHTYEKAKIASLHIIEVGMYESNQRQNRGMPGCQKYEYLKSQIDANCIIEHQSYINVEAN
jgi:hypothetical protein